MSDKLREALREALRNMVSLAGPYFTDATQQLALEEARAALAAEEKSVLAIEQCARECERHLEFLTAQANNGGDFKYLMARADEAAYLAKQLRNLPPSSKDEP